MKIVFKLTKICIIIMNKCITLTEFHISGCKQTEILCTTEQEHLKQF